MRMKYDPIAIEKALQDGEHVYAKEPGYGDWIRIDAIRTDGWVRNAEIEEYLGHPKPGAWFTPRDVEVQ